MKKLKKILSSSIFLGVLLTAVLENNVNASSFTDSIKEKEYSQSYKNYLQLSDEEKKNVIEPMKYDTGIPAVTYKNPMLRAKMLRAGVNSKFSLNDLIPTNLTIRNQMQTNSCWAFATLSSLETNLALANYKNQTNTQKVYDYSERHMVYTTSRNFLNDTENDIGYNKTPSSGGSWLMSETYLANGYGAVPESEMPFENNENVIDISTIQNKTVSTQLYDTTDYGAYSQLDDSQKQVMINAIKQQIQNYGSVYASLHGGESDSGETNCYNPNTYAKYCDDLSTHKANHAVSIIGWDDDYSKDNFLENHKPKSNGAWIVRNSWGEDYGDKGICYVSYEDANISSHGMQGITKALDVLNYDNKYYYDEYGPNLVLTLNKPTMFLSNTFDKKTQGTEYLNQVMVYSSGNYEYKVYVNPNGTGKSKSDLQQVQLKNGDSQMLTAGNHILEFAKPVEIKGDKFTVVVEIINPAGSTVSFYCEGQYTIKTTDEYSKMKVENGKCFALVSDNLENNSWEDMGKMASTDARLPNADSTIKAYTTDTLIDESLKSIEIKTMPTKTSYKEREDFDGTGMVITAKYNSKINPTKDIDISKCKIVDGEDLQLDTKTVTVEYEGQTVTVPITVTENPLESMEITTPPTKTKYVIGQSFDKTGMKITGKYESGITREITDYTITDGEKLTLDQTSVTISFKDKIVTQPITVEDKKATKIEITTRPKKVEYIQNKEDLDLSEGILTITYNDNTTEEISLASKDVTVSGFDNTKLGKNEITVNYLEQTTSFEVEIVKENQAKNSDLSNIKANATKVQAFYYKKDSSKDYTLIDVEVEGISKSSGNDKLEYYYYLSSKDNEQDIADWVKIPDTQSDDSKLKFTVDTRNIPNYDELAKEDNLYIYVKEVATKGEDQNTAISEAAKLTMTAEKMETYVDGDTVNDIDSGSSTNSSLSTNGKIDKTTASNSKLPNAGIKSIIVIIVLVGAVGIFGFIRYKNLGKYIK